jgi:DNA-binding transcriptional LysR family regulator
MELAQLRQFATLADEMNFGRAAAQLEIGQPVLSRSIQRLEKSLGVALIDRSHKKIALTPAGTAFAAECRATLAQAGLARDIARRAGEGEFGTIRIGLVPTALHHGFHRGVREFRRRWPKVELTLQSGFFDDQIAALRSGGLDLAFFYQNVPAIRHEDLSVRVIDRATHFAAIPSAWPLARRKRLRLAELADCPFVFSQFDSTGIPQALLAACRAAGFVPRIVQEVQGAAMLHSLVACEVGVAFISRHAVMSQVDGISFVPIADMPAFVYVEFAMAWVTRRMSRPLEALIGCIEAAPAAPAAAGSSPRKRGPSLEN